MNKKPILPVNAVGVHLEDGVHVLTIGSWKAPTVRYGFDETHYLLLITEYAKSKGIDLSKYFPEEDKPEAKAFTPWTVKGGKQ